MFIQVYIYFKTKAQEYKELNTVINNFYLLFTKGNIRGIYCVITSLLKMTTQRICAVFQKYKTLDLSYLQGDTIYIRKYERNYSNGIYVHPIWSENFKVTNQPKNKHEAIIHCSLFDTSNFWGD